MAAQRKIKWLGTGAEIEAPKALRSETPKASRGMGNGDGEGVLSYAKKFIQLHTE